MAKVPEKRYPLRGERVHPGAIEELGELAMAVVWEKEAEEARLQGLGDEGALRMRRA